MKFSATLQLVLIAISVLCIAVLLVFKYQLALNNKTNRISQKYSNGPEKQYNASVKKVLAVHEVIQLPSQQDHSKVVEDIDDFDPDILPGVTWNLPGGYKKEHVKKQRLAIPRCTMSGHRYLSKVGAST